MSIPSILKILFELAVYPGVVFIVVLSLIYEWLDRKIVAHTQHRIGPLYTGPFGMLQPFADILKLLSKEDITLPFSEKVMSSISVWLLLYLTLFGFYFIPTGAFGEKYSILHFEGDYLIALTILTLITIFTFLSGYSTFNRFALVGAARAISLMVAYEIPALICAAAIVISSKTLCLSKIAMLQGRGGILKYYALTQPLGFIVFLICTQAELERIPFDIPEAKQEIVAGWITEFSGFKLALLKLCFDVELFYSAALITTLYLGGPWAFGRTSILIFLAKTTIVVVILSIIRSIFARFRIDQALRFFWTRVMPLAFIQLIIVVFLYLR